jgi:predicted RNase H-like nuclease (RuvC/YqgF family)
MSKGDALSVGDEVMVKDAEGNFVQAPEGRHELEGGLVLYVDELGFINELETKETEESDDMKAMFEAVSQLTILVGELKNTISDITKENNELNEKFNKFSAEPSVESVTKKQATLSKSADKLERAKFFGGR